MGRSASAAGSSLAHLEDVVIVNLHTTIDSEDEATECQSARDADENVHRPHTALTRDGFTVLVWLIIIVDERLGVLILLDFHL